MNVAGCERSAVEAIMGHLENDTDAQLHHLRSGLVHLRELHNDLMAEVVARIEAAEEARKDMQARAPGVGINTRGLLTAHRRRIDEIIQAHHNAVIAR